jgi:CBS domain-containing protein
MSKDVITISSDMQIDACMQLMTDKRIRHLPVVDNGKSLGIISIGDVVRLMIDEQKYLIEQLQKFVTS